MDLPDDCNGSHAHRCYRDAWRRLIVENCSGCSLCPPCETDVLPVQTSADRNVRATLLGASKQADLMIVQDEMRRISSVLIL